MSIYLAHHWGIIGLTLSSSSLLVSSPMKHFLSISCLHSRTWTWYVKVILICHSPEQEGDIARQVVTAFPSDRNNWTHPALSSGLTHGETQHTFIRNNARSIISKHTHFTTSSRNLKGEVGGFKPFFLFFSFCLIALHHPQCRAELKCLDHV